MSPTPTLIEKRSLSAQKLEKTMAHATQASAKPVIRISPNPPVFDLPLLVALQHGLFEKAELDVRYVAEYGSHDPLEKNVLQRQKESLFEQQSADTFNVCEWGGIDRLERGKGKGKIAALRPAIVAQAIVAVDPKLQTPRDLAGVPIGVNEFTGSHYTTVGLLEGAVGADNVRITHIGAPEVRLDILRRGDVRAVTVMEPYITLALKQGAHLVALTFYRGAEVISPALNAAQREAYLGVLDQAADLINADFARYAHYITAGTKGALRPEELDTRFIRYTHVERYAAEKFEPAYTWMKQHGFSAGANTHESLVV
jgi:NitT/TauT family transport system substrate-binding protein